MEVRTYLRLRPLAPNTPQPTYEISPDHKMFVLKEVPSSIQPSGSASSLKRKLTNNEPPQD